MTLHTSHQTFMLYLLKENKIAYIYMAKYSQDDTFVLSDNFNFAYYKLAFIIKSKASCDRK
jgi:hypothetical protein